MDVDKNDLPLENSDTIEVISPDLTEIVESETPKTDREAPVAAGTASCPEWSFLCQKITEIHDAVTNRIKSDAVKERAFERLYNDLDELKKNKTFEDYKSLFIDLVLLFDRIQLFKSNNGDSESSVLESILDELTEILSRRDIEIIKSDQDLFDPRFQRIVKTQIVDTADLDGRVIRILREGFTSRFGILRPQEVVVGKYPSPSKDPELNIKKED